MTHLAVLQAEERLRIWTDRDLTAGDDWFPEIVAAMDGARVAVMLISANFLTSPFILREEVPHLLARRRREGMTVVPVIVRSCAWKKVKWLARIQPRPAGKPLAARGGDQVDAALAKIAAEILELVEEDTAAGEAPSPAAARKVERPGVKRRKRKPASGAAPPAAAAAGDEWKRPVDGSVLVYVPGGEYTLGSNYIRNEEKPVHRVRPFGTLDQAGNVWEWCADVWDTDAYDGRDGQEDPLNERGDAAVRVVRGGSWSLPAGHLQAAYRYGIWVSDRHRNLGFRVVFRAPSEP